MSNYTERIEKLEEELTKSDFWFGISRNFRGSIVYNGLNQDSTEKRLLEAHAQQRNPGDFILDLLVEIEFGI